MVDSSFQVSSSSPILYNRTEKGYPLKIEATKIEFEASPFDAEFIQALLPKIDYTTLLFALKQISENGNADLAQTIIPELPESIKEDGEGEVDEALLKKLHTVMFDIHVVEGELVCPDTGRRFNIKMGIPNMILHADEL
jgi:multifunctional methyltransferase subunit TRM112